MTIPQTNAHQIEGATLSVWDISQSIRNKQTDLTSLPSTKFGRERHELLEEHVTNGIGSQWWHERSVFIFVLSIWFHKSTVSTPWSIILENGSQPRSDSERKWFNTRQFITRPFRIDWISSRWYLPVLAQLGTYIYLPVYVQAVQDIKLSWKIITPGGKTDLYLLGPIWWVVFHCESYKQRWVEILLIDRLKSSINFPPFWFFPTCSYHREQFDYRVTFNTYIHTYIYANISIYTHLTWKSWQLTLILSISR